MSNQVITRIELQNLIFVVPCRTNCDNFIKGNTHMCVIVLEVCIFSFG